VIRKREYWHLNTSLVNVNRKREVFILTDLGSSLKSTTWLSIIVVITPGAIHLSSKIDELRAHPKFEIMIHCKPE
jgi:hypothetical protein